MPRRHGWLGLLLLATIGAGCRSSVPVDEGCDVLCECITFLPSERAECVSDCVGAATTDSGPSAECLECAADQQECSDLFSACPCGGPLGPGDPEAP